MKRFPDCEIIKNDPIIPLEEKQSKIIFENPERIEVCLLEVDDCAIQQGIRCDYALTGKLIEDEFYVELKGRDVKHAFKQLETTIQQISEDPKKQPKHCFIISTRCPLNGPEIQKMQKLMKKQYTAKLIIKNRQHKHVLR